MTEESDWNELITVLVILLREWDLSNKLEDGYGKETGDGRRSCFLGSRAG